MAAFPSSGIGEKEEGSYRLRWVTKKERKKNGTKNIPATTKEVYSAVFSHFPFSVVTFLRTTKETLQLRAAFKYVKVPWWEIAVCEFKGCDLSAIIDYSFKQLGHPATPLALVVLMEPVHHPSSVGGKCRRDTAVHLAPSQC